MAAKTDDVAGWEKACRMQAMYATKLRKDDEKAAAAQLWALSDDCADRPKKPWGN